MAPKQPKTDLEKVSTKQLLRSIKRNLKEKLRSAEASLSKSKKGKR